MTNFLAIGSLVGMVIGLFHAWVDFSNRMKRGPHHQTGTRPPDLVSALYAALWLVALWTIFGAYVLALWIISLPIYALFGRFKRTAKPITVE